MEVLSGKLESKKYELIFTLLDTLTRHNDVQMIKQKIFVLFQAS